MQDEVQHSRDTQTELAAWPGDAGMPQALRARRPDRDAQALLRWFNLVPRVYETPLRAQRELWRLTALAMGQRLPVASVITHTIEGPAGPIQIRLFSARSSRELRPAFLWCHGGGFIVGGLDTADSICRTIARNTDCVAIAVSYRLAPEHDLLAGREDFLAAVKWVATNGAALGIDTTRLAIGGDSAGGNICAAVAQHCVRHGGPDLCLQVLAYPATDLETEFPSLVENEEGFLIDARMLYKIKDTVWASLDGSDPWLSPRRSTDLHGLPPAVVISAGFDPIRDDGLDYTARLRTAGVPVQLLHYPGQFHGFLNFDSVIGAGHDGLRQIGLALTAAFRGEPAANRTIEVADRAPPPRPRVLSVANELAATTLLGWATAERVYLTLLGRLSSTVERASLSLLASSLAPGALLHRFTITNADRLNIRQTFPVTSGEGGSRTDRSNNTAFSATA